MTSNTTALMDATTTTGMIRDTDFTKYMPQLPSHSSSTIKKLQLKFNPMRYHLGVVHFILLLPLLFGNISKYHHHNNVIHSCHAYRGMIDIHTPLRQIYSWNHRSHRKVLQQLENSNNRYWQICNTRKLKHRSSFRTVRSIPAVTTISESEQITTEEGRITEAFEDDSRCCPDHQDDSNRHSTNDMVIRNVCASTIDPILWQQYMVPTLSWWDTAVASRIIPNHTSRNPYGTTIDISLPWNFTLDDAKITAVAGRFLELYDTTTALSKPRPSPWWTTISVSTATTVPNHPHREAMIQNIASAMKQFSTFCNDHHTHTNNDSRRSVSFTMRLLCTYGGSSRAGTKCPIWHIDHVPCRYIQTFYGPTCMLINNNRDNHIVYRRITQDHDSDDDEEFVSVEDRNEVLLRGMDATRSVGQAVVGEGIILLGNAWSQWATGSGVADDANVNAAVHKSPPMTTPNQGRILLTINVHE